MNLYAQVTSILIANIFILSDVVLSELSYEKARIENWKPFLNYKAKRLKINTFQQKFYIIFFCGRRETNKGSSVDDQLSSYLKPFQP